MRTIGSHPGAILFRLGVMIILIAIMMLVFFSYLDETRKKMERTSIMQTKRIIDSSLAVVFATYAVKGRLSEIDELDGGNPFVFLQEYKLLPLTYLGEIDHDLTDDLAPGWYFLTHRKQVVYTSRYLEADFYFALVLNYDDLNQSGGFEPGIDHFQNLQFVEKARIQNRA